MKELFDKVSFKTSKFTANSYSTSFSLGIRFLGKQFREPIYSIYGFVRFADEIVDTFHDYDKAYLLNKFREDTWEAIDQGISLNPIFNSFQHTVRKYNIQRALIETFLDSMAMDLSETSYDQESFETYILGSAEVVGLMCLKVFCEGSEEKYNELKYYAMRLGSAFQKINFLRDMRADYLHLGRAYFPGLKIEQFDEPTKKQFEADIAQDFAEGYRGIQMLPEGSKFGVYVAYVYYQRLFAKIRHTPSSRILDERIRIPNSRKFALFLGSYARYSFRML